MANQVNQYERHMAIQEAYQIHDSDEYFKARPQLECGDRRKVFYAGHIRGYQAATQACESEINSLKERVEELQADNNQLRAAGQAVVERWDSPNWSDGTHTRDYIDALRKALSSTPAQSLVEHDNATIDRCKNIVADDALAITFQSMGAYRSAIIKHIGQLKATP